MIRRTQTILSRKASILLPALACAAALSGSARAQEAPLPLGGISSVTFNGTGCPANSATAEISTDRRSFSIAFDDYDATLTGGSIAVKDCQIAVAFDASPDFQYSIDSLTVEGDATLDAGVSAQLTARACPAGSPDTCSIADDVTLTGSGTTVDVSRAFVFATPILAESECGAPRNINITTRMIVRNKGASGAKGSLRLFSTEGTARFTVRATPRSC